jgi:urease accessory protein
MLRVERVVNRPAPDSHSVAPANLVLSFEQRQKSRFLAQLSDGREIGVMLPRGAKLRHGDLLEAEDGTLIQVQAAKQKVLRVTAETPVQLARAAYHLGNRHTPVELRGSCLILEHDSVLKEMLEGLQVQVEETELPFEPEPGAYSSGEHFHQHSHSHGNEPDEEHRIAQELFRKHHGDTHAATSAQSQRQQTDS